MAATFFRVVFFMPLMVTPVGIAYTFRMLADMTAGPARRQSGSWLGLGDFSWATDAWSARIVVHGRRHLAVDPLHLHRHARCDRKPAEGPGGGRLRSTAPAVWQIFRDITWPAIAPVAATVVLIRMIEAFKIIDLPNVLTNGGPGIATESMTLHSFIAWRTLDLGGSAAVAYMLLFISTIICVSFFNFVVAARVRGGR